MKFTYAVTFSFVADGFTYLNGCDLFDCPKEAVAKVNELMRVPDTRKLKFHVIREDESVEEVVPKS